MESDAENERAARGTNKKNIRIVLQQKMRRTVSDTRSEEQEGEEEEEQQQQRRNREGREYGSDSKAQRATERKAIHLL